MQTYSQWLDSESARMSADTGCSLAECRRSIIDPERRYLDKYAPNAGPVDSPAVARSILGLVGSTGEFWRWAQHHRITVCDSARASVLRA